MDGQVLGGGVIALVAVALWLVYLLPTLIARSRYDAAERNALRLGRALRVLAETSETPQEVHVELTARQAHAQQKLARKAQAEVERLQRERERIVAEEQRLQRERERRELERRRRELEAAQRAQARERGPARARRITRLVSTAVLVAGLLAVVAGAVALPSGWPVMTAGSVASVLAVSVLQRMARVAARAAARPAEAPVAVERPAQQESRIIDEADRGWTPRPLPAPLVATAGSHAATTVAAQHAREALLQAAREEALRERAEPAQPAPVSIESARAAAGSSPFARMGYVDDEEIEAHVRQLLARRAAG